MKRVTTCRATSKNAARFLEAASVIASALPAVKYQQSNHAAYKFDDHAGKPYGSVVRESGPPIHHLAGTKPVRFNDVTMTPA